MTGIEPDKPVVISSCKSVAGAEVDAPGKHNVPLGGNKEAGVQHPPTCAFNQFRGQPALMHQEQQTCTCTCTADLMRVF